VSCCRLMWTWLEIFSFFLFFFFPFFFYLFSFSFIYFLYTYIFSFYFFFLPFSFFFFFLFFFPSFFLFSPPFSCAAFSVFLFPPRSGWQHPRDELMWLAAGSRICVGGSEMMLGRSSAQCWPQLGSGPSPVSMELLCATRAWAGTGQIQTPRRSFCW